MVVGGDFSATGLARPVCIEVAETPFSEKFDTGRRSKIKTTPND